MAQCRDSASRGATAGILAAFDPVLYVSALSERGCFTSASTAMQVGRRQYT